MATEYWRCEGWHYQFSWGQLGFSQVTGLVGLPLYPLIGVYGVTALILVTNTTLMILCSRHTARQRLVAIASIAGVIVLALVAHPLQQQIPLHGMRSPITALVVQDETPGTKQLMALTRTAVQHHRADLIVWREYAAGTIVGDPHRESPLRQLARSLHSTMVFGCTEAVNGSTKNYNSAMIIAPDGRTLGIYHKRHPVQTMEVETIPGKDAPTFSSPVGRLGVAICYDFDYAACTWQLVQHGAELLVVPTYDAEGWSALQHTQHARMAQARAAESGRWVIRATSSGVSQIISPHGNVVAHIANGRAAVASAVVSPMTYHTPYIRVGYLLPYACMFLTGLLLIMLVYRIMRSMITRSVTTPIGTPEHVS